MNCAEVQELYGAIVLDALPSDELAAVNAHLATCASCREALQPLRQVAVRLLDVAPPAEPSTALRGRILAAARADLAEAQRNGVADPVPLAPPKISTVSATGERPVVSAAPPSVLERRDTAWWRRPGWGVAAAFVALAVGLGAWNVTLQRQIERTDSRLARTEERLASSEQALSAVGADGRSAAVASNRPGAVGTLLRPAGGAPALVLHGLAPQPGAVYQMWVVRGNETTSIGVLAPDDRGDAWMPLPETVANADAVAVTVEPAPNGSTVPTSAPILTALLRG